MIEKLKASGRPLSFWIGIGLIVILLIGASVWVFWPQQQVLFSNLAPEDAAQITAQLDKQKIPYKLANGGATILTSPELIPKARLQVFSQEVNLKSGVGLELFSGNDLGMTEFSQHVNFVRALQGELTRTLLSIDGVESARVHIAMPERTTRRSQANNTTKVAITLNSKQTVSQETVRGIQRLTAAAIPGVTQADVVILDGKGNLLTSSLVAASDPNSNTTVLTAQLEQKAAIEAYLEKKAKKLLISIAPPPSKVEALVDVTLSERQSQVTREEIIPSGKMNGLPIGVLQKGRFHKDSSTETTAVTDLEESISSSPTKKSAQDDYEFVTGRQIERIENPIGAVERISISVVISGNLPANAEAALRQTLSKALGLNTKRGDDIAVLLMPALPASSSIAAPMATSATASPIEQDESSVANTTQKNAPIDGFRLYAVIAIAVVVLLAVIFILAPNRRSRKADPDALAEELRALLQDNTGRTV